MPWSSNATFLATVSLDGVDMPAIYKPHRGERPLWDFPDGLYLREAAAYVLSDVLGWGVVPETVVRVDGPLGPGSFQRFVPADFSEHYYTLLEDEARHDALKVIAAFDLVANNADRKSGHCLLGEDGRIWGIDQGLCFHVEPKLRTVMWDFGGEAVPDALLDDLRRLDSAPLERLCPCLSDAEVRAVAKRARAVVRSGLFPNPPQDHRAYPWPLV
ncbi:MAG TPA: SCO1664 family protein [Acidimicrobiales bacterium]|jgi:uncharacterized repeat protein (TIGR03843 family)|nr:SCO1664 family protein [Acidimicrobiales bacterium]